MPKRRRTSDHVFNDGGDQMGHQTLPLMDPSIAAANGGQYVAGAQAGQMPFYMPIFNGMSDAFKDDSMAGRGGPDFSMGYGSMGRGDDDDDQGDGDYIDHLQQPGNTKKRKVPSAAHQVPPDDRSPGGLDDEAPSRPALARLDHDGEPSVTTAALVPLRRKKTSHATLAGLQHKEMLKTRKRQLAAVLGAVTHGDTLALDQALAARYPSVPGATLTTPKPIDYVAPPSPPRRRPMWRRSAAGKENLRPLLLAPACEFTFECPNASA